MMIMIVMMTILITPYILGSIYSAETNRAEQMFETNNLNQPNPKSKPKSNVQWLEINQLAIYKRGREFRDSVP